MFKLSKWKNDATISTSQSLKARTNETSQNRTSPIENQWWHHVEYNRQKAKGTILEENNPHTTYPAKTESYPPNQSQDLLQESFPAQRDALPKPTTMSPPIRLGSPTSPLHSVFCNNDSPP
jgi:hypothetical protein